MASHVVMIGLDSVESTRLLDWMDQGLLPTLAKLRERAAWGETTSPHAFGNSVFWASMFTGMNPGRHGQYYYKQIVPGTYRIGTFLEERDYQARAWWEKLGSAGKRVAIIDLVRSPLSPQVNGLQVCDWMVHDRTGRPRSTPPSAIKDILARFGDDPFGGSSEGADRALDDWSELVALMKKRIDVRTRHAEELLKGDNWDVFAAVYCDPHDIGHQAWHLHDPTHAQHDPEIVRAIGDPVLQVYQAIDTGIGRLLEAAGRDATVVVFGGPGMENGYTANHLLDPILRRLEFGPDAEARTAWDKAKAMARKALSARVRLLLGDRMEKIMDVAARRDRARRKCFAVSHNENSGAIRINLVGREPEGKVQPGADYDAYCAQLTRDLLELVNPDFGVPLIREVVRVADHCRGEHMAMLPDLMVIWNRPHPIEAAASPKIGELRQRKIGVRTGDHSDRGFLMAVGPSVLPGRLNERPSVMDVGATIPALVGVPLNDLDGTPIRELVRGNA